MIPKIIHYSWFSGEPFPEDLVKIMDSWKKHLPDYEFRLWDGDALKTLNLSFANEAISVRKWAFASDQLRIYAVYTYGGIWLDTDVEVFKSFDPFLSHRMFIGHEDGMKHSFEDAQQLLVTLTSHCFGAEAGHPFLKRCFDYYEGRHFITSKDKTLPVGFWQDQRILPDIQAVLAKEFGYIGHPFSLYKEEVLNDDIHVYPAHYFDAPKYHSMDEVVCIHHRKGAWFNNKGSAIVRKEKNLAYYIHKMITSFLERRGVLVKMYYVGLPNQ